MFLFSNNRTPVLLQNWFLVLDTANGKETSEVYNANGTLIETKISIKPDDLLAPVLAKFKGVKIVEAAKITNADGNICYEAEVKGEDLLFDAKGNSLKP
ncbi:hypothetical protein ACJVDH_06475 [Pedobacter sp. AW1-32]|uniref:hypothetical protein n=1 Tax=Pedobacter sp. AW1-32 TaxID=3383026 RepID=UPI003FEE96E2